MSECKTGTKLVIFRLYYKAIIVFDNDFVIKRNVTSLVPVLHLVIP